MKKSYLTYSLHPSLQIHDKAERVQKWHVQKILFYGGFCVEVNKQTYSAEAIRVQETYVRLVTRK